MSFNARQAAFLILRQIDRKATYTDAALDQILRQNTLKAEDRSLVTELVYGIVRRQRSLDAILDQLGKKPIQQQPPDLRRILQLGLYQLRYLNSIPESAAVNTSVNLAKQYRLSSLAGVVNGVLRQYLRLMQQNNDPLLMGLPLDSVTRLGRLHSFPDWMVNLWLSEWEEAEIAEMCKWFNRSPMIDLRVNRLQTKVETVKAVFHDIGLEVERVPHLSQSLRLGHKRKSIQQLPGFNDGWWTVQDSSAQLVSYLLAPQPGETIIDACAAPGGKTTHIAEIMGDRGHVLAIDRSASRLRKVIQNSRRLKLNSIHIHQTDSRHCSAFIDSADRVLLDAPCSGLGTLHRHPDIRWRQSPESITQLSQIQTELLTQVSTWVKPKGILVYSTCTLNRIENEDRIRTFLDSHPTWFIQQPEPESLLTPFVESEGWIRILPHHHQMDGFFLVKLVRGN